MKPQDQKIIFLHSYLPRTGHNFASEVIKIFSNHQVLAHNRSETRLSTILAFYSKTKKRNSFEADKKLLDTLFIKDLRKKIILQSQHNFVMIKDTTFVGVDLLPEIFPDDHHFLLIRDPKNVFASLLKGMSLKKKSFKNRAKKWGTSSGFYPYSYSKKLSQQVLRTFPDLSKHTVIKYEDLVMKNEELLLNLKEKFNTPKTTEQIKEEIDEIGVINSSFYKEVNAKAIWDVKPKTNDFKPLDRKGTGYLVRKGIELGSSKLRKKLNYI